MAGKDGSVECLKLLIEHGAKIKPDTLGRTALHSAVRRIGGPHPTDEAALARLRVLMTARNGMKYIDSTAQIVPKVTIHRYTVLHEAVELGLTNTVRFLIESKANIHASSLPFCGRTPLWHTKTASHFAAAKILVAAGACTHALDTPTCFVRLANVGPSTPPDLAAWLKSVQETPRESVRGVRLRLQQGRRATR